MHLSCSKALHEDIQGKTFQEGQDLDVTDPQNNFAPAHQMRYRAIICNLSAVAQEKPDPYRGCSFMRLG